MKRGLFSKLLVLASFFIFTGCQIIDDGMAGVSKSFGTFNDEPLDAGFHFDVPVFREIEAWDLKVRKLVRNLEMPSSEALTVQMQVALNYRTVDVVNIRKTIGTDFQNKVVIPALNDAIREHIGKVRTEEIIGSQEKLIEKIQGELISRLEPSGFEIKELNITSLKLPAKFQAAVENKIEQEQKAQQKEFELRQAKQDAQIEVARAEGAAEAQKIVRSTLSAEYLQYLWISTLNENPNVIYVATEANMPMFRTTAK